MLYTISEVSKLINLSKVSIYKKLKLKELEEHISKKQGITYISEVGFNLIRDSLKVNSDDLKDLNVKEIDNSLNVEIATDTDDLSLNKELLNALLEQLKIKDIGVRQRFV